MGGLIIGEWIGPENGWSLAVVIRFYVSVAPGTSPHTSQAPPRRQRDEFMNNNLKCIYPFLFVISSLFPNDDL